MARRAVLQRKVKLMNKNVLSAIARKIIGDSIKPDDAEYYIPTHDFIVEEIKNAEYCEMNCKSIDGVRHIRLDCMQSRRVWGISIDGWVECGNIDEKRLRFLEILTDIKKLGIEVIDMT